MLEDDLDGVFRLHAERGVEAAGEVMPPVPPSQPGGSRAEWLSLKQEDLYTRPSKASAETQQE